MRFSLLLLLPPLVAPQPATLLAAQTTTTTATDSTARTVPVTVWDRTMRITVTLPGKTDTLRLGSTADRDTLLYERAHNPLLPVVAAYKDTVATLRAGTTPPPKDTAIVTPPPKDTTSAPPPPPPTSGGKGNLFSNGFESGRFDAPFTDGGTGSLTNGIYGIVSPACVGSKTAQFSLGAGARDQAAHLFWNPDKAHNDLWVRVVIRVLTMPSAGLATQKMVIFRARGYGEQFGEMNQIGGRWIWNWLDGGRNMDVAPIHVGQCDTFLLHYDNTGTLATITIWQNGVQVYASSKAKKAAPGMVEFGGTLNGGSGASKAQFDGIEIGTVKP